MIRGSAHIPVSLPKLSPQESAHLHQTCEVLCHSQFPKLKWSRCVSLVSHRQFRSPNIFVHGRVLTWKKIHQKNLDRHNDSENGEQKNFDRNRKQRPSSHRDTLLGSPHDKNEQKIVLSAYMWRACEPSKGRDESGTPCLSGHSQNPMSNCSWMTHSRVALLPSSLQCAREPQII